MLTFENIVGLELFNLFCWQQQCNHEVLGRHVLSWAVGQALPMVSSTCQPNEIVYLSAQVKVINDEMMSLSATLGSIL